MYVDGSGRAIVAGHHKGIRRAADGELLAGNKGGSVFFPCFPRFRLLFAYPSLLACSLSHSQLHSHSLTHHLLTLSLSLTLTSLPSLTSLASLSLSLSISLSLSLSLSLHSLYSLHSRPSLPLLHSHSLTHSITNSPHSLRALRDRDVISCRLDETGALYFGLNGTESAKPSFVLDGSDRFYVYLRQSNGRTSTLINVGAGKHGAGSDGGRLGNDDADDLHLGNRLGGDDADAGVHYHADDADVDGDEEMAEPPLRERKPPTHLVLQTNGRPGLVRLNTFSARGVDAAVAFSSLLSADGFSFSVRLEQVCSRTRVGLRDHSRWWHPMYVDRQGLARARDLEPLVCFARPLRAGDVVSCKVDGATGSVTFGLGGVDNAESTWTLESLENLSIYLCQADRCSTTLLSVTGLGAQFDNSPEDHGDEMDERDEMEDPHEMVGSSSAGAYDGELYEGEAANRGGVPAWLLLQTAKQARGRVAGSTFTPVAQAGCPAYGAAPLPPDFVISIRLEGCGPKTAFGLASRNIASGKVVVRRVFVGGNGKLFQVYNNRRKEPHGCFERALRRNDLVTLRLERGRSLYFGLNGKENRNPLTLDFAPHYLYMYETPPRSMTFVHEQGESTFQKRCLVVRMSGNSFVRAISLHSAIDAGSSVDPHIR